MSTTRFRIQGGLYSGPKQWQLPDGTEYIGIYYRYRGGNAFSGTSPNDPTTQPLTVYDENFQLFRTYGRAAKRLTGRRFQEIRPATPLPDATDYETGYWKRYFVRHANDAAAVFETDASQFDRWQQSNDLENSFYEGAVIQWKLTGKREDTITDAAVVEGVASFNARTSKRSQLGDLTAYVGDVLQFTVHDPDLPIELRRKVSNVV